MSRICVLAAQEVDEFIKSDGRRTQPKTPINHETHEHVSRVEAERLTSEPLRKRGGEVICRARWVPAWATEEPIRLAIVRNDAHDWEWRKKMSGGFAVQQLVHE